MADRWLQKGHGGAPDRMRTSHIADFARDIEPSQSIERPNVDIRCGRFSIGNHLSEVTPSQHATLVLSTNCSGRLHSDIDGANSSVTIKSGALTFVPPRMKQIYDFSGDSTNTVLAISEELFKRVTQLSPELGSVVGLEPRIPFIRPRLHRLVEDYYNVMASDEAGWRIQAEAYALSIARELFLAFSGKDVEQAGALPLNQEELGQLIEFIEAELENNFDLSDLAEVLGRNPFGFSRSFRAATGESPHQFVIQRRLSKAKELLEHTDDPLAEIAYATGFSNQSHMTATFTKHLGTPPGAYRKAVRG